MIRILSPDEVQKLFALDLGVRNNTIIQVLYWCGLRVSELTSLTINDVYFGSEVQRFISIRKENSKTDIARDVQLHENIKTVLKEYYKWLYTENKNQMLGTGMPLFFMPCRPDSPITSRQVERIIKDAGIKAGIPGLHPHIFRHTILTLLSKKVDLPTVQAFAGHRSLQSTQVYMHPSSEDINKGVNQL